MVPVEPGVNRLMEDNTAPLSGICRPQCRASRRAPLGTNDLATQRTKRFVQVHNSPIRECNFTSIAVSFRNRSRRVRPAKLRFALLGLPYCARSRFSLIRAETRRLEGASFSPPRPRARELGHGHTV